jgi:SAM-dependent methyltransferase
VWDERYGNDGYLFGTEPARFLTKHVQLLSAGDSALVVADGEGRNSVFLAGQGLTVTAMDASPVGLAKAERLAGQRGVSVDYQLADITTWPWAERSYDVVVAIFIQFLSPADRATVFQGMVQALRPGGLLLLHGYRPKQLEYGTGGPPIEENLYTEELLAEAFADLNVSRLVSYDAEIEEGTGHVGMSALIDLIATKPA